MKEICIATRGSQLALWQANHIKDLIEKKHLNIQVKLEIIKTQGDKILDVALAKVGGKGLFVKEIEEALLDKRADIAVHSLKDVPMVLPQGLHIAAYPTREMPQDLFISEKHSTFQSLPQKAILGTSSLRRQAQALALRPDLEIKLLRGNVETRIRKMQEGEYDAIILAAAGVKRLDLKAAFQEVLDINNFLPAVGQGCLAIEARQDDEEINSIISFLDNPSDRLCVEAERAFMRTLEGGCQVPIAAYAQIDDSNSSDSHPIFTLRTKIARPDGSTVLEASKSSQNPEECGVSLAHEMIQNGGKKILEEILSL